MIKAILTKPLDGDAEGAPREFSKADFDMLHAAGAVIAAPDEAEQLREDGPTVDEYVAASYKAANYPPAGYASRSTEDDIAAAIGRQQEADAMSVEKVDLTDKPVATDSAIATDVGKKPAIKKAAKPA